MRRRTVLAGAAGLASCGGERRPMVVATAKPSVAVLKASSYEGELLDSLERGLLATWPEAKMALLDKRVLLKPNLVEFDEKTCINTDPRFVWAVRELFLKFGAAEVKIGEGPGHRRDTWDLAEMAGYRKIFRGFDDAFTDLNLDNVRPVRAYDDSMDLYLPRTVLDADLVVSVAKMKTHHWAGATLSMKNFFGVVPGAIYGWPKNLLHYQGIDRSIRELNRIVNKTYAIVDGVVGMEGNGPIHGTPVAAGVVVMGRSLPAVDATCARVMKLDPTKMAFLSESAVAEGDIEQRGELVASVARAFAVIDQFAGLRVS